MEWAQISGGSWQAYERRRRRTNAAGAHIVGVQRLSSGLTNADVQRRAVLRKPNRRHRQRAAAARLGINVSSDSASSSLLRHDAGRPAGPGRAADVWGLTDGRRAPETKPPVHSRVLLTAG